MFYLNFLLSILGEDVRILKNWIGFQFLIHYIKLEVVFCTTKHHYILFVHLVIYNSFLIEHLIRSAHMLTLCFMKYVRSEPYKGLQGHQVLWIVGLRARAANTQKWGIAKLILVFSERPKVSVFTKS
jgi:hypothetical protein